MVMLHTGVFYSLGNQQLLNAKRLKVVLEV